MRHKRHWFTSTVDTYRQNAEHELWGMISAGVFLLVLCVGTVWAVIFLAYYVF